MTDKPVSLLFILLADYGNKNGAAPLSQFEACWEKQIDEQWWIAMNGHQEPKACSHGNMVESFSCYVEFNGFPAGMIYPFGGILAAGSAANEDIFIEALKAAGAVE